MSALRRWPRCGGRCDARTCSSPTRDGGCAPPSVARPHCSPHARCAPCWQLTLGYAAFEDARLELAVTATDIVTGAALVLNGGPVVDAVTASSAIPGLLPPVRRGESTLVDGAIGHPATLAYADALGVDDIYLLPAGYPCAAPPPATALGVGLTGLNLLLHHQLVDQVRAYTGRARLHVAPPLCPLATSAADFAHADDLMRRAHASTRLWLSQPSDPISSTDQNVRNTAVLAFHDPHPQDTTATPAPPQPMSLLSPQRKDRFREPLSSHRPERRHPHSP